jgi:hypothetical protein
VAELVEPQARRYTEKFKSRPKKFGRLFYLSGVPFFAEIYHGRAGRT